MTRTLFIGDVHGRAEELDALLHECGWRPGDRAALGGDPGAEGPDPAGRGARARGRGRVALRGVQRHPHALGLDSGCVYGRHLTAYVLPEGRFYSVKAKRAYMEL